MTPPAASASSTSPAGAESALRRKRVLVVIAGGTDPAGDATPLADAEVPTLARIARRGRAGVLRTAAATPWEGFCEILGLGAAAPSLAAADAAGAGIAVAPHEIVWRADFVTLGGRGIHDPWGGGIHGGEAEELLRAASVALPGARLHRLAGARNLAVTAGPAEASAPPWAMTGRPASAGFSPTGRVREWFEAARVALAQHDVNSVRVDLRENPANALWFHGAGGACVRGLASPFGSRVALVGRGTCTQGLAAALGWTPHVVDGDDEALAAAALAALGSAGDDGADLVVLRTETALVAAAAGHAARRDSLSALDARLIAPLLGALEEADGYAMAVVSDCAFDSRVHAAVRGAAVCAVVRDGDANAGPARFTESECARSGFHADPATLAALLA